MFCLIILLDNIQCSLFIFLLAPLFLLPPISFKNQYDIGGGSTLCIYLFYLFINVIITDVSIPLTSSFKDGNLFVSILLGKIFGTSSEAGIGCLVNNISCPVELVCCDSGNDKETWSMSHSSILLHTKWWCCQRCQSWRQNVTISCTQSGS